MFNKEIKALKQETKKILNSKEIKKLEIKEIEEREKIIKEYEKEELSSKSSFKRFLTGAGIPLIVTLVMLVTRKISFFEFVNYLLLGEVATSFVWNDALQDYRESKKTMRKISHIEYQKAKEKEKSDKELKISLSKECLEFDQEILDLNEHIKEIKKENITQKLGCTVDQFFSFFKGYQERIPKEQREEFCNQLLDQYLTNQYYNHIYYDSHELDNNQKLEKKQEIGK